VFELESSASAEFDAGELGGKVSIYGCKLPVLPCGSFLQRDIGLSGSEDTNSSICNKSSMVISVRTFKKCPFLYLL
jgi:hypothetical protein